MKRPLLIGAVTAIVALVIWGSQARSVPEDGETAKIMRQKVTAAQAVLESIATEDYLKMAQAAGELADLSNRAEWFAKRDDQYVRFSQEFRYQAMELQRNAHARQLDAATLNYVRLTMACVDCHKYLRNPKSVRPLD